MPARRLACSIHCSTAQPAQSRFARSSRRSRPSRDCRSKRFSKKVHAQTKDYTRIPIQLDRSMVQASGRERLEAAGRRGIELGPVDLLLETMIGFIADRAFAAQALERLALVLDRAQPQLVVLGRRLRIVRLLRHSAGGSILVAHGCCCR